LPVVGQRTTGIPDGSKWNWGDTLELERLPKDSPGSLETMKYDGFRRSLHCGKRKRLNRPTSSQP